MITDKKLTEWFEKLNNDGAIYLWGANAEVITKELCDKLYKTFKSNTYNKTYYDNKLKEGKGKIGADCSGSLKPMSGYDNTASGYYNDCEEKGAIRNLPLDKVRLVFKESSSGVINHVGLYCGNGYTIEMKSSKDNVHKERFNKSRWTYYGKPKWLEDAIEEIVTAITKESSKDEVKWLQTSLNKVLKGKYPLDIDGEYGNNTRIAVLIYWETIGWNKDGKDTGWKVGTSTVKSLKAK